MVAILISAAFIDAALIRGKVVIYLFILFTPCLMLTNYKADIKMIILVMQNYE